MTFVIIDRTNLIMMTHTMMSYMVMMVRWEVKCVMVHSIGLAGVAVLDTTCVPDALGLKNLVR